MSASQVPLRPIKRGSVAKLWLAIAALVIAALAIAWAGAAPLKGVTTENGVMVRTLEAGEGELITDQDGAFVSYEGRLEDGEVFDSSNGQPVPMLVQGVVPGFAEALQQMREGGSYEIRIPSELAYGDSPPPGSIIKPGDDLYFSVEIAQVVRDAAQLVGPPPTAPNAPQGEDAPAEETPAN
ncbi:FKBP-type peptidyl-prolyl cis-trans isomerase [Sphingomicrobium lutaoense]|uniref:Peptidyl-prolyl cis-trans isomerase n=1 Tax=Sphingomicrobium lutaoense TaxID=515949 RepID=A0A839Z0X6_9SPHN|nr:FKBP-type peptidyl-prolyl cis-trans isomerase [Sphingomicrobium lutaoense]MBB3764989.1 FKBP-type peptidyl-prolyl cis-trans isomerase FkpA [Sphingomicrobium lutaoense]